MLIKKIVIICDSNDNSPFLFYMRRIQQEEDETHAWYWTDVTYKK